MSPQHFPQLSSVPIHISKLAELAQHPPESTKAMLGKPLSLFQSSSSCSFDTTSHRTSVPSDLSLPINPFQNPECDETLMISPTFTQSSISDLIPLSKPTKLATRTSLPNFSTSHLLHRGGLMTIPFPSFDDDEEHAITEPIARSTLECASALGNRTLRRSQPSNKKDSLELSDQVHEVMATIRKPSRPNARSFLIGRKFDLDNDSLYGPQQSTDDEDDFKPEDSPTAKGSRSRPSNSKLEPMAAITRYPETSSPSRSRPTVHPLPMSNQTPFPCMSVEDQANEDESPKPLARRFSIRKFSLRKHSGPQSANCHHTSSSALSTLPSTSASPEDIRRVNLGVERCGGLGNKMFDSGMRTLKRIVTAPPRSSSAVPSTTADSPASSQADRRLSLETPSRAFGSSLKGGSPIYTELGLFGAPSGVQTPETKPSTPLVLLQRNHNIEDSPGAWNQTLSSSVDNTVDFSSRTLSPIPRPSRLSDLHQLDPYARSPRAQFDPELSGVHTEGEGLESDAQPDSTVNLAKLDELFCSWRLLCHQVDQELKQSRERWPDTALSKEALRTFVMPSSKDAIFEFLAHSRETYGNSLPAPRRKPRTGLHSIFNNHSQLDETEDTQSPHSRGLTPPPKHPFGSKPATPIYLRARSYQSPSSGANSPAQVPIIVTLPVPSAFVSPERFISPPSSLPRVRKSRKSSLISNAPPTRPSSKYVDRIRNESIHSLVGVPPLTERSPNMSPVTHKPSSGLSRTYKLSTENGKTKDYNRDGLVDSLISSSPVRLKPICQISESSRKTKKAWKMGEKGKKVQKMTSQSSFWDTNESSLVNEEIQEEEQEEETGVLVASGENTFDGNADLAGGAFTPGRSLRRYPSGRTPLFNRLNARSMLQLRSSVRSINRI
ncbi:hypothetical protein CROQUDRAFT_603596 [Cronartium quercuum f. sp. fusiforme G11]|uniref:Uncharacterized protein n=1 Tax=Cronartium quercuum f. sp. fusiforme G11 TaxID=708437 RepID=A0A9P6NFW9_9BASI|nr:hypothetical protein CROQUDRAFT_603596 [Cronartium quercuum f. sp. fusiforme G11]